MIVSFFIENLVERLATVGWPQSLNSVVT